MFTFLFVQQQTYRPTSAKVWNLHHKMNNEGKNYDDHAVPVQFVGVNFSATVKQFNPRKNLKEKKNAVESPLKKRERKATPTP